MIFTKPAALLLLLCPVLALAESGHPLTLWLAEGESNRVYLLGSVHLLRREDHPLPDAIDTAYDDAETIFMELDMDDIDAVAMQATVTRLGVLDDGRTLRDLMGESLYAKAETTAAKIDIPLELLAQSEPWLAAITIEQMILARIGFEPRYGIEMHFSTRAAEDGKPILGFETFEEQLAFLDGLSIEAQRELLLQTLAEGQDIETLMDDVIEAWRLGDTHYLETTILADFAQYPELHDRIVTERNHRWVERIDGLLDDDQDYLVIVGALHLVGEEGLPALLTRRGFEIRQMRQH